MNYLVYSGGAWLVNGAGYSGAMTTTDLVANIPSLTVSTGQLILRAYLHSDDGSTTPEINSVSLTYTYEGL